jgi:hypothetical protein
MLFRASPSFHTGATNTFLTTRQLCYSLCLMNTSLAIQKLPYSLVYVFWPGLSSPPLLVSRRRPHYVPSSLPSIRCCGANTALSKLRPASSYSSQIPLASPSVCRKHIVDVRAATFAVPRSSPLRLPPALPPLLCCLFLFFNTPAQMHVSNGRWHSNFVWHPGSECRTQPTVISNPFRALLFICYTPAQRLGFSRTAPYQWCLSPMCSLADAAYRRRHAEPACLHFLQASLASPAFHGSTLSSSTGCLHCQILHLLSRHPAFHGCSQSLHVISSSHPAACGTWNRLVVSR